MEYPFKVSKQQHQNFSKKSLIFYAYIICLRSKKHILSIKKIISNLIYKKLNMNIYLINNSNKNE